MRSEKTNANLPESVVAHSTLPLRLFDPGMSILHRAGLGGLATTLRYIERAYRNHELKDKDVPGGPWKNGKAPWKIEPLQITLNFGEHKNARSFLKKLFEIAFEIRDGLIFLPGQYGNSPPNVEVRAEIQAGLTLTFLQHGKARTFTKTEITKTYEYDGKPVTVAFRTCSGFKHQEGWRTLSDENGGFARGPVDVMGALNPGATVRHVAFSADTGIEEEPGRALALYFALVGCLTLPINRGTGALIIPEVADLAAFARLRPHMTPGKHHECRVASASDAALQAQVRLVAKRLVNSNDLPACFAATFRPTPWASQQKSRVQTMYIPRGTDLRLRQYETALRELRPRLVARKSSESDSSGKKMKNTEKSEWFWADSIVRPLVADNLARGRRWYEGFAQLMLKKDPVNNRPLRDRLFFEKEGLHAMTQKEIAWQDNGESVVVRAVHEAIRGCYGQIAKENEDNPAGRKKRWKRANERWRLAFAGAKTPDQFRGALCDLFGRAGLNKTLQAQWPDLLPMLHNSRWSLCRDLALLALASYKGKGVEEIQPDAEETASAGPAK